MPPRKSGLKSSKRSRRSSSESTGIKIVVGALACVGVAVGVWFAWPTLKSMVPAQLKMVPAKISQVLSTDSSESVQADLKQWRSRVEATFNNLPAGDQSEESATKLRPHLAELDLLMRRAARLPTIPGDVAKYYQDVETRRREFEARRNQPVGSTPQPKPHPVWHISGSHNRDDHVTMISGELTTGSLAVEWVAREALLDYPDPMTVKTDGLDWSAEDRRVLAIVRQQGALIRECIGPLATALEQGPNPDLTPIYAVIDRAVASSQALRQIPREGKGAVTRIPRVNPYEPQLKAAKAALTSLKRGWGPQQELSPALAYLFQEINRVSEAIDDITFGKGAEVLDTRLSTADRYAAHLAAESAQASRQQDQGAQQTFAPSRQSPTPVPESSSPAADKPSSESDSKSTANNSGKDADHSSQGSEENAPSFPPGFGRGPRGFGRPGQRPPFPSPGFGSMPDGIVGGSGELPGRPSGNGPPSQNPAQTVTITVDDAPRSEPAKLQEERAKWLQSYPIQIQKSNRHLQIVIQNYDRPLSELKTGFPSLEVTHIDEAKRTIVARERPVAQ